MPVLTLYPSTGSGGTAQHTPVGDSPNWKCVDETPSDDDTTYVENSNVGVQLLQDRYGLQNSGGQVGPIISVIAWINVRCSLVGTTQTAATLIRTGGSNFIGFANPLTLVPSYTTYSTTYTTNPDTLADWTWAEIDALQAGVNTNVDGADVRCTQVYVEVTYGSAFMPSTTATIQTTGGQPSFVFTGGGDTEEHEMYVLDPRSRIPSVRSMKG